MRQSSSEAYSRSPGEEIMSLLRNAKGHDRIRTDLLRSVGIPLAVLSIRV
jgi:hypothetical protein